MQKNLVRVVLNRANKTWKCPGGVQRVIVYPNPNKLEGVIGGAQGAFSLSKVSTAGTADKYNLYSWGYNAEAQLGDNTLIMKSSPVIVSGSNFYSKFFLSKTNSLSTSESNLAIDTNGNTWNWGDNFSGQLGDGTTIRRSSPVLVAGLYKFNKAALSPSSKIAIDNNGAAFAWGSNNSGCLGVGDTNDRSSPTQVVGPNRWKDIWTNGAITYGINEKGLLWRWGSIDFVNSPFSSPTLVVPSKAFKQVAIGGNFALFLDVTGQAWAMGDDNQYGQFGNGNTTSNTSSPVMVLSSQKFERIFAFNNSCYAIGKNGRLYSWGRNNASQLALGDQVNRSSPVLVTGDPFENPFDYRVIDLKGGTNFIGIHVEQNDLWMAGENGFGQCTGNPGINQSYPELVGKYIQYDLGNSTSYAADADGYLWAWGSANSGRLGDNTIVSKSSPVAVSNQLGRITRFSMLPPNLKYFTVKPGRDYSVEFSEGYVTFNQSPISYKNCEEVILEYYS